MSRYRTARKKMCMSTQRVIFYSTPSCSY